MLSIKLDNRVVHVKGGLRLHPMPRPGADLALLLLGGFRVLADRTTDELAARGYQDYRPVHDFALSAILAGADNASELGRRMSVSKQAAAKTIAALEERNYVSRKPDSTDGRRMRLQVTEHGLAIMREGAAIMDELRRQWEQQVGAGPMAQFEDTLRQLVGSNTVRLDTPGSLPRTRADSPPPPDPTTAMASTTPGATRRRWWNMATTTTTRRMKATTSPGTPAGRPRPMFRPITAIRDPSSKKPTVDQLSDPRCHLAPSQ